MNTATFKTTTAIISGITFAAISIYCSALLWWSFAETLTDQIIAAIIGSGFVVCQYLFHANKNYLTTAVLFTISAAATVGWIESRYDSIKTNDLTSNTSYTEKSKTLTQLNNTLALQNLSAKNDLANTTINFTGRANRTLAKANQTQVAIKQLESEIKHLQNANPSNQKSGSAIANQLAEWRWLLWALLAAMIDIIPMICFKIAKTETLIETLQPSLQKSLQPSSQLGATTETQTETTDPLLQILKQEITNNEWGETIPMKRIMAKHNARHERLKPIFEQLIESKVIERQGNRYINTQTQTKVQEQTA